MRFLCNSTSSKDLATSAMYFGIIVATLLAFLKYITLLVTDSVSIKLTLADSCLDIFVSLINYIATVLSFRRHKNYPYGYDKITSLAASLQIFLLLWFAYTSCVDAHDKMLAGATIVPSLLAIFSLLISSIMTIVLIRYQNYVIQKTGHLVVYADKMHYTTDLLTNFSMLGYFSIAWLIGTENNQYAEGARILILLRNFDSILTIFLSLYISYCCIRVAKATWNTIMDKRLSVQQENIIINIITKTPQILDAKIVSSRFSGVKQYFEIALKFDLAHNIEEVTKIINSMQHAIRLELQDNVCCHFMLSET